MVNSIGSLAGEAPTTGVLSPRPRLIPRDLRVGQARDTVSLGTGERISTRQATEIVIERAMEKLRAVVDNAREELGIPEGAVIDTSPEATAGRIADFALGFFPKYAENHGLNDDEEGRKQFADFIGGAIQQGIGEARSILMSLSALNPEIESNISSTWDIIQQRLDDFVANGLSAN